jgi:hypothetical protein
MLVTMFGEIEALNEGHNIWDHRQQSSLYFRLSTSELDVQRFVWPRRFLEPADIINEEVASQSRACLPSAILEAEHP